MTDNWGIYAVVFMAVVVVMVRLDRLGKQLEAVHSSILVELAQTEDQKTELLNEWKHNKKQAAKEARQFWIFWGAVGVGLAAWRLFLSS